MCVRDIDINKTVYCHLLGVSTPTIRLLLEQHYLLCCNELSVLFRQ